MAIAIQPYTADRIPAVKAFNQRLAAGGIRPEFHFPESNIPDWLPKEDGRRIYQEYYLAVDGKEVRGGFILKYQDFLLGGESLPVVFYRLPVSEGIVDKAYTSVGVLMLRSAMRMHPCLFALGMGGFDRPLPTMLKAMSWKLSVVPFYFRVQHPAVFLRQIAPLRQSAARRALAGFAAASGAGSVGIKALHWLRTKSMAAGISAEPIKSFGSWADDLWKQHASGYAMIADRGNATLNLLYPPGKNFLCIKTVCENRVLGWAVVLDTQMRNNKYFGSLRVGTIADAFAASENAAAVVRCATRFLEDRGVDLVVANHSSTAWGNAFRAAGYLQASSNFIFAASKPLAAKLTNVEANQAQVYLMRGDGDGPVNL
ncbi:MAG: hypothetical protein WA628_19255 [Terriglobales bacterium]